MAGVLYADKPDLKAMVTLAVPEFNTLDADQQQAALAAIGAINPYVKRTVEHSGGEKIDGKRQKSVEKVTYQVAKGEPVLVPNLQYLENSRADHRKQSED
jgi:hypothetical protein